VKRTYKVPLENLEKRGVGKGCRSAIRRFGRLFGKTHANGDQQPDTTLEHKKHSAQYPRHRMFTSPSKVDIEMLKTEFSSPMPVLDPYWAVA